MGCILRPEYWKNGYASEILRALLAFGFTTLGLHRVYGKCDDLNTASAHALEKGGLVVRGHAPRACLAPGYTDLLIDLARQITDQPPAREMDMLLSTGEQVSVALMAMAIHSLGHKALSLTGAQIGIVTDSTHTKARIQSISTERIRKALDAGNIVIAAGFQGIDESLDITTLGRGGSDTTAVALAAVLHADACEIYTDVDGVYTTDPRVVPEARQLRQISYDEMLELATAGAGRDAQPLDRVRQEVLRAGPRPQQLQRQDRHDDRQRAGSGRA